MTKRQKAAARVAQEIVQTIYAEGLQPGQRYLSEADALARHGVSRATFREALRFLEFQGVIVVRAGPGGGAMVQRPSSPHLASTFALLLQFADSTRAEIMAAREALEPAMAAMAATNIDETSVAELFACIEEARTNVTDFPSFKRAYRRFWTTIAQATGNAVTALLWPALRELVDSGGFVPNERFRQVLIERMGEMAQAVAAHDALAASETIGKVDREITSRLTRLYPLQFSRSVAWSDIRPDQA